VDDQDAANAQARAVTAFVMMGFQSLALLPEQQVLFA
jgi:hypothetical protein